MTFAPALAALLGDAAQLWWAIKQPLKAAVNDDALHVLAGAIVQLAAALTLRRPLASISPWLAVLALEVLNEAGDLVIERWPDRARQLAEGGWDLAVTMALPTLVLLGARLLLAASRRQQP